MSGINWNENSVKLIDKKMILKLIICFIILQIIILFAISEDKPCPSKDFSLDKSYGHPKNYEIVLIKAQLHTPFVPEKKVIIYDRQQKIAIRDIILREQLSHPQFPEDHRIQAEVLIPIQALPLIKNLSKNIDIYPSAMESSIVNNKRMHYDRSF